MNEIEQLRAERRSLKNDVCRLELQLDQVQRFYKAKAEQAAKLAEALRKIRHVRIEARAYLVIDDIAAAALAEYESTTEPARPTQEPPK